MSQVSAEQIIDTEEQPPVPQAVTGLPTGRLIDYVLEKLFAFCPEIDAGIVATYEGLLLGARAREQEKAEDVGAITSLILEESTRVLRELDHGRVTQLLIVGTQGYTLLKTVGDEAFLAVTSRGNAIQRATYHAFLKAARALEVLDGWLK
jgi:predicted regulator of Ras-like GTPase activity (Roadblock/LC7/MglB family)